MFCYQCQETSGGRGCTVAGACGKTAQVADLQDRLIAALKKIASTQAPSRELGRFIIVAMFTTVTNTNFDSEQLQAEYDEAQRLLHGNGGSNVDDLYPIGVLAESDEDVRSLKELLIYGLKGVCAYATHAYVLGYEDDSIYEFVFRALAATGKSRRVSELFNLVLECGQIAVAAMRLLDRANVETFGKPEQTTVNIRVGDRPGVLLSGHDLRDFQEFLEQSKDEGVDVYTHSEGLPANYYPELKKYKHLVGNYGGAWHSQQKDFASFNGPIVMTTNCIVPVREEYKDRIFTTGPVGYPGVKRIPERPHGGRKDFSCVIAMAKELDAPSPIEEDERKGSIVGGFAHDQVFSLIDQIVEAVRSGKIKRFIVAAGCDGRQRSREYFTELAKILPKDYVILTAGCAKFRYIKLDLGYVEGTNIPRILDAGQCNDSYSLALIAFKLRDLFGLDDVNDLPISFAVGWYEQKAVAVLLALLALGFKDVRIGPTLPAFLSPGVLKILVEKFGVKKTTTPQEDLEAMRNGK